MLIAVCGVIFIITALATTARMMSEAEHICKALWPTYAAVWCAIALVFFYT